MNRRQLCQEVGAQYIEGGFWKGEKVQVHHGQWTITLDTYTEIQPHIYLTVKDDEGRFRPHFPEGSDESVSVVLEEVRFNDPISDHCSGRWHHVDHRPLIQSHGEERVSQPLSFTMKSLGGKEVALSKYQGKVVMIVNVASKCGLTPQYRQLQALHEKYAKDGLAILGFPCNQFLSQEPGTADEIKEFCRVNYGVSFDLFSKIEVNGDGACDLYKCLTAVDTKPVGAGKISWNFEKFIVGRNGEVVARFAPRTKPDAPEVLRVIEAELAKK